VHEITVAVSASPTLAASDLDTLVATFHEQHLAQFAYNREGMPIECLHWRVAAIGSSRLASQPARVEAGATSRDPTPARIAEAYSTVTGDLAETPIFDVADLGLGVSVSGPAIIAAPTTTIVLHADDVLRRQVPEGFLIDVAGDAPLTAGARSFSDEASIDGAGPTTSSRL
jgi:N-methylhydantoinase A